MKRNIYDFWLSPSCALSFLFQLVQELDELIAD
jgi:hypothetical protein